MVKILGYDTSKIKTEEGYRLKSVYNVPPFNDMIHPPIVRTPEDKSPFKAFVPSKNNSWNLETEDFTLMNLDPRPGVNFKFGDIWAIIAGCGDIYCNKYKNGKIQQGWLGIGTPETLSYIDKIQMLERRIADMKAMLEKSMDARKEMELKYEKVQNEINKVKGKGFPQISPGMMGYQEGEEMER